MNVVKSLIILLFYGNCVLCFTLLKNAKPSKNEPIEFNSNQRQSSNYKNVIQKVHNYNTTEAYSPAATKFTTFEKCQPCPKIAKCVPPIQCPAHLRMSSHPQLCDLPSGGSYHGICCTSGQNHTTKDYFQKHRKTRASDNSMMEEVFHNARQEYQHMLHEEMEHKGMRGQVENYHPDFFHNMFFSNHRPSDNLEIISLSHQGFEQMIASRIYKNEQQITLEESQLDHFERDLSRTPLAKTCPMKPLCPSKLPMYRSIDGTCNHLDGRSSWGAARTPMARLLPPSYEDGIWSPRVTASDGSKLNSARTISRTLFPDFDRPHPKLNLLVMQYGQFLSHDFAQSSSITLPDGGRIRCCGEDGSILPPSSTHFACFPIFIDGEDEFYRQFNQRCMNFVRLMITPDHDCRLGYAKTLSKVTHYIDASTVYGSDAQTLQDLRSFRGGRLRMFIDFNRELLPLDPNSEECSRQGSKCFLAGDVRVNQHVTLVALHILFAREHNRLADGLAAVNPHWSDEVLFQEARRIVSAEIQHIAYNEWLPNVIGATTARRFSLLTPVEGYSNDYDEFTNPSVTNEFTVAAFRFGHSTVQGKLFIERNHELDEILLLSDTFNNPSRYRFPHFFDEILRTLTNEPMQSVDNSVTFGLSRFLFRNGNPFGMDLLSLNIQRGRDEAVRPYNDYLDLSGHKLVRNFAELGLHVGERMSKVYRSPDDIDLFVGGLLEAADGESIVGPTFREIIADQFSRLRRGDRYFYDLSPAINPGAFTPKQLQQIRKISMARVICDNSDKIALRSQSPYAFVQPDYAGNDLLACDGPGIPRIDLSAWRD